MQTTKVFKSGNSQAIRIPKEYQVEDEELIINKVGNTIILFPKNDPWGLFKKSLGEFTDDYFAEGRNQPKTQERKA
jgi:antitoxin VapB